MNMLDSFVSSENIGRYLFGCDVSSCSAVTALEILQVIKQISDEHLEQFNLMGSSNSRMKLFLLTEKRNSNTSFNTWQFIEKYNLENFIDYFPYYFRNPIDDPAGLCQVWIEKNTPKRMLEIPTLLSALEQSHHNRSILGDGKTHVLFFTASHPLKKEGNSAYIRMWLDALKEAGVITHLVYYEVDINSFSPELLDQSARIYPNFYRVPVKSALVGKYDNELNNHVDDWCGIELIEFIQKLCDQQEIKAAIVNYASYSKIFEVLPKDSIKILLTHDYFANRNKRLLEYGFTDAGWMSLTEDGERIACQRADLVVAIQEDEKKYFIDLVGNKDQVVLIPQIFEKRYFEHNSTSKKLKIGYFGSPNFLNIQSLTAFLTEFEKNKYLSDKCKILLAGKASEKISYFIEQSVLDGLDIQILGEIESVDSLFNQCDLVINPEIGGTGLKIKTLETLSTGTPIISTKAGFAGISTDNPYHQGEGISDVLSFCEEICRDRTLLAGLSQSSVRIYDTFYEQHKNALSSVVSSLSGLSRNGIQEDQQKISSSAGEVNVIKNGQNFPKVSVIIPFYNVQDYIEECLLSVMKQSYSNLEIILVDDCSPDNSRAIVEGYKEKDPRITILTHINNQGLGPGRNTGVSNCSGEFVFFLDSDDYLRENCISSLVETALREDVPVVIGSAERVQPSGEISDYDRIYNHNNPDFFGLIPGEEAYMRAYCYPDKPYLPLRAWGTLFQKDLLTNSGIQFISTDHEDMGAIPFYYYIAGKVYYKNDIVMVYRLREGSTSVKVWDQGRTERYYSLWHQILGNIESLNLDLHRSNTGLAIINHLLYRIEQHGLDPGSAEIVTKFLNDVGSVFDPALANQKFFCQMMWNMRNALFQKYNSKEFYLICTKGFPIALLHEYYKQIV